MHVFVSHFNQKCRIDETSLLHRFRYKRGMAFLPCMLRTILVSSMMACSAAHGFSESNPTDSNGLQLSSGYELEIPEENHAQAASTDLNWTETVLMGRMYRTIRR